MSTVPKQPKPEDEGGFLALMRHRNYALIWTGQLVSLAGDRIQWVAIALWVYALTRSALAVSYAVMALLIGPVMVGFYAGAVVDRLDRRRILITCDLIRGALVFAIPALIVRGITWVYLDLFLVSAATAFFRPAMYAAIPQSVPRNRLHPANAFFASMDTSTEIYGPFLAGVLVARFGYSAAVYVNALSYFVSAAFVSALRLARVEPRREAPRDAKENGALALIKEGLQYVRADRLQMGLLALLFTGHWLAGLSSLQTPLAKGVLHVTDSQFGWYQSIFGVGFVSAGLLLGYFGGRIPRVRVIVFGYAFWALATAMMGISTNYGMLVVTGFWVGFANMLLFVNTSTLLMEYTPPDRIGRVLSTRQVVLAAVRGASLILFGWLADLTTVTASILTMAVFSFLATLAAVAWFPVLWKYRERVVPRTAEEVAVGREATPASRYGFLRHHLEVHTAPEFAIAEQRWLNAAVQLVVGLGWLGLLAREPVGALGFATAVAAAVVIVARARAFRQLQKAPAGDPARGAGRHPP